MLTESQADEITEWTRTLVLNSRGPSGKSSPDLGRPGTGPPPEAQAA